MKTWIANRRNKDLQPPHDTRRHGVVLIHGVASWTLDRRWLCLGLLVLTTACRSPYYADRGAVFGGLTGAGVGATIGHASGNTGAGAVIGSAVGALTGAVVGNEMDVMRAENQAMIDQRLAQRVQGATTAQDVVNMTRAGLSDEVIANHIRTRGVAQPPSTNDLISLKNEGVTDGVIRAMQEMSAVPPPIGTSPVIVEQHYVGPPPWYGPHYGDYYGHHGWRYARRYRPSTSWGVSFAH